MSEPTILIVEDERDINYILRTNFKKEGYNVLSATTAEAGLKLARQHRPDICILDIMLPNMDGLEMMKVLRQESQTPVLFLTAKKDEIDRILGLKMGADDYITKPFSIRELNYRVKAILNRTAFQARTGESGSLRMGELEVDLEKHDVRVKGKSVTLAPREFQLLKLLIEAEGKVLSREQLAVCIWGDDESIDIDIRTVDQHIARLRRKLGAERHRVATVNNFGYQVRSDDRDGPAKTKRALAKTGAGR
ncbi:MAG: response regulator transcription factor [Elusimicrobia bacterium]|nr:response regulator transcription factor [Elusimicrobiota bacterium]